MFDFPAPHEPCRQLLIVPPEGAAFDAPELHAVIKQFLDRNIPEFSYVVSVTGPFRDDSFIIAPVVHVAAGVASKVAKAPPPARLAEIRKLNRTGFAGGSKP